MFRTLAAKALLGVGVLAVVGGTTALAASPAAGNAVQNATGGKHDHRKDRAGGTVVKVSDTELTVERHRTGKKDPTGNSQPATVSATFVLNKATKVYKFGDKDKQLGIDALKVGQRVGIKFHDADGKKVADKVVILPDARAGTIESKDADGKSFAIKTKDGKTVQVTTSDKTRFVEGRGKNRHQVSYADLKVGDKVVVLGEEDNQHNFDALVVRSGNHDKKAPAKKQP